MTEEFALPQEFDDADFEVVAEAPATNIEVATLLPTGGQRVYLPIERDENGAIKPVTIMQAALSSGLTIPENTQFYVDGVAVNPTSTTLAPGMVVTAVGNVKGG